MKSELWAPISGYEGYYSASTHGRIKSEARVVTGKKKKTVSERILKPENNKGYLRVFLTKDGKTTPFYTSRVVFESFNGKVTPGNQVDHIDGDKHNNNLDNLREATPSQNRIYALEKKYNTVMIPGYVESDPGRAIFMSQAFEAGRKVGYDRGFMDGQLSCK